MRAIEGRSVAARARESIGAALVLVLLAACDTTPPDVVDADVATPATDSAPASAPTPGDPLPAEVEPYVVKGRVVDAHGNPLAGVEVGADDTLLYDSNAVAVTDTAGSYRIDLSSLETSWRMWGYHRVEFDGQNFQFDLAVDEAPFSSSDGAVRDFTWQLSGPYVKDPDLFYGGFAYVYQDFDSYAIEDLDLVTLHLTPSGPLVDGSAGAPLDLAVVGGQVQDIPVGRYAVSATYGPPGAEPQELGVRPRNAGEYAGTTEIGFVAGSGSTPMTELEVRLP